MLHSILKHGRHAFFLGLLVAMFVAGSLFAQESAPTGPKDKSSWVMAYGLTGLGIVLGLVAVCRPGNRSSEVRVDDED